MQKKVKLADYEMTTTLGTGKSKLTNLVKALLEELDWRRARKTASSTQLKF